MWCVCVFVCVCFFYVFCGFNVLDILSLCIWSFFFMFVFWLVLFFGGLGFGRVSLR